MIISRMTKQSPCQVPVDVALDCEFCGKVFIPKGVSPWEPEKIIALALHVAEFHDTWGSDEQQERLSRSQNHKKYACGKR